MKHPLIYTACLGAGALAGYIACLLISDKNKESHPPEFAEAMVAFGEVFGDLPPTGKDWQEAWQKLRDVDEMERNLAHAQMIEAAEISHVIGELLVKHRYDEALEASRLKVFGFLEAGYQNPDPDSAPGSVRAAEVRERIQASDWNASEPSPARQLDVILEAMRGGVDEMPDAESWKSIRQASSQEAHRRFNQGFAGLYTTQLKWGLIEPAKYGGWATRSFLVVDPQMRKRLRRGLQDRYLADPGPFNAFALISPVLFDYDDAFANELLAAARQDPFLAAYLQDRYQNNWLPRIIQLRDRE